VDVAQAKKKTSSQLEGQTLSSSSSPSPGMLQLEDQARLVVQKHKVWSLAETEVVESRLAVCSASREVETETQVP
jgi:hypothetical protein